MLDRARTQNQPTNHHGTACHHPTTFHTGHGRQANDTPRSTAAGHGLPLVGAMETTLATALAQSPGLASQKAEPSQGHWPWPFATTTGTAPLHRRPHAPLTHTDRSAATALAQNHPKPSTACGAALAGAMKTALATALAQNPGPASQAGQRHWPWPFATTTGTAPLHRRPHAPLTNTDRSDTIALAKETSTGTSR